LDKLVAKVNWSFNRWKGFDWESFQRRHQSGFDFVREMGYAHEWWNFYEGFSPDKYYGFILREPRGFHKGITLFISMNPLNGRWYFVGFYCDAVRPPTYASTGVPVRDLLPAEVIKMLEESVRMGGISDKHLDYVHRVISGEEEFLGILVAPKECSASFLPEAYVEVHPEDIGVKRLEGQWKITYKVTRSQIERLLEEAKRRHEVIDSEEAREIVRRIDRALKKLRAWPLDRQHMTTSSEGAKGYINLFISPEIVGIKGQIGNTEIIGDVTNEHYLRELNDYPQDFFTLVFKVAEHIRRKMGVSKEEISEIRIRAHKRVLFSVDVVSTSRNIRYRLHQLDNGRIELLHVHELISGSYGRIVQNSTVLELYHEIPMAETPLFDSSEYVINLGARREKKKGARRLPNFPQELPSFPRELLDRYEPLEFLGEGGFAKVFKVKRKNDGKIVALKIPRIDERTSSLFIKEVAAWYNLHHENIVRLYKADILPVPYLEMEFVEGVKVNGTLVRNLEKYPKPVDEKMVLKIIKGIASGLAHAHSRGIYHLDLKPLNVLLKSDLTPKITDWGLAKISARSSLSRHYGYSPLYAAPEQLDEETFGVPDHRTDIYQLGLIFYELLTGELPYKATSPGALVGKILHAKPRPVSGINGGLKKFDGIFEKLLAKKKEERYQSVEEFLSVLESLGELEREKEELRKTSMAMRRSRSREEVERLKKESIRKTVKIAILSAKLNDKAELLAALDDLKFYTRENFDDLMNAIAQIETLLKEGIPISAEVEERIRALVLRIEGEVEKFG